jgi:hypothetical protein
VDDEVEDEADDEAADEEEDVDEQPPSAITPNAASTVTVVPRLLRAAGPVAIVISPWFARVLGGSVLPRG